MFWPLNAFPLQLMFLRFVKPVIFLRFCNAFNYQFDMNST